MTFSKKKSINMDILEEIQFSPYFKAKNQKHFGFTGKSLLKALILASTSPQYEKDCSLIYQFNT